MSEHDSGYRSPGLDIEALVDAPLTPIFRPSPCKRHALLLEYTAAPPLSLVAEPFLGLAGLRIAPRTQTSRSTSHVHGVSFISLLDGAESEGDRPERLTIALPPGVERVVGLSWSPTGRRAALSVMRDAAMRLLLLDVETLKLSDPCPKLALNDVLSAEARWLPGGERLLLATIPADRGPAPGAERVASSPKIQHTHARSATVRTYQDLLQSELDEALFEHYATSQLVELDLTQDTTRHFGPPALYTTAVHSPDGSLVLMRRLKAPFSRLVPAYYFASELELWDTERAALVRPIASLPVAEEVPRQGVRTGPRGVQWQPLEPKQLFWAEALDGGDPMAEVPHREQLKLWDLYDETQGEPRDFIKLKERFRGIIWLDEPGSALISEYERERRWLTTTLHDTDGEREPRVIFDRSAQDSYNAPGTPLAKRRLDMTRVAILEDGALFLVGPGSSPEGDRPFVDRFDLASGQKTRLFEADSESYAAPIGFGPKSGPVRTVLLRRESPSKPPNYFLRELDEERTERQLTFEPDPHPQLTGVHRELLTYEREDGVPLSGTLYLPRDYKQGARLPLVIWAYPIEYTDASAAGQVRAQPTAFARLASTSPLMFLARGYAVLDRATMPIVGDVETMNETFVEQITQSAEAAVRAVVDRGVADPERVGVAGHSYGAFMAANLLAHTDGIFKAAIARSGAYNRSLTPFGFQGERRSLWEAPEMYIKLSPFFHADAIDKPLLLIHGEDDPNSGTFPFQSERLFHALQGLGGTAKLVVLPHEGHGYRARQSVLHVLAEQFDWFDEYLK